MLIDVDKEKFNKNKLTFYFPIWENYSKENWLP